MNSEFGISSGLEAGESVVRIQGLGVVFYPNNDYERSMFMAELELKCRALKAAESAVHVDNNRFMTAMAVYVEYCENAAPEFKETFDNWLRERLNPPKAADFTKR